MAKKALSYTANSSLPISIGDTSPNPGVPGVSVWSTIENSEVWWNGASWQKPGLALSDGFPADVSNYPSSGVQTVAARGDHAHSHGQQSDPTQHALVTYSEAGFMSPNDKILLDAISTEPEGVELATVTATTVQGAGDVGVSEKAAREDHAHAHGTHTDGLLHAGASGSASGFMSPSQFTKLAGVEANAQVVTLARVNSATGRDAAVDGQKLDSMEQGATNTLAPPLAPSAAPPAIGSTGSAGSAGTYATATHTHAGVTSFSGRQGAISSATGDYNSSQIGNSSSIPTSTTVTDALNYIANTLINGKADKTTTITAGPGLTGGGSLVGNLTLSVGTINNTQHGNLGGGTLHALASYLPGTTYTPGFMSGQDKEILDTLATTGSGGFSTTPQPEQVVPQSTGRLYVQQVAGREMLAYAPKNNLLSNILQPHLGTTRFGLFQAGGYTGPTLFNWVEATTGTVTQNQGGVGNIASGIGYSTPASAGTSASTKMQNWGVSRLGGNWNGFHYICHFSFTDVASLPARWFVGLSHYSSTFSNSAETSDQLTFLVGVGMDSGDTTIKFITGANSVGDKLILNTGFEKPFESPSQTAAHHYEVHIYAPPGIASKVSYLLKRLEINPKETAWGEQIIWQDALYIPTVYCNNFISASSKQIVVHSQYLESNR